MSAPIDRIIKLPELEQIVGIKKVTIYAKIKDCTFPKQVKLTPKSVGWKLSDIQKYISELEYVA